MHPLTDHVTEKESPISFADLGVEVVAGALTVPERIELLRVRPEAFRPNHERAAARVRAWRRAMGADDQAFATRLRQLEVSEAELPTLLGDLDRCEGPRPAWWSICERVLATQVTRGADDLPRLPDADADGGDDRRRPRPIRFAHAVVPWVEVATAELRRQCPRVDAILGAAVLRNERHGLTADLARCVSRTLEASFEQHFAALYADERMLRLLEDPPPTSAYAKAVEEATFAGCAGFMRRHPALARLLATRVMFWIRSLGEIAERLEADRPWIEAVLHEGRPLGELRSGGRGISDGHNGGRAVMVCRFEHGVVVYKPRSMAIDAGWIRIVELLNESLDPMLRLRTARVLDRGTHGWMEFLPRRPCRDLEELRTFHRRVGATLAVVHALQGNDFHSENLVASGPDPVAIDLETITVGEPIAADPDLEREPAVEIVHRSVTRTLMLPQVFARRDRRGGLMNLGALGGDAAGSRSQQLVHPYSDVARWEEVPDEPPSDDDPSVQSRPTLADGGEIDPMNHRGEVVDGFRAAYRAILAQRERWSPSGDLGRAIAGAWSRVINRPTNVYLRLGFETCRAGLASQGVDRWIHAERLRVGASQWQALPSRTVEVVRAISDAEGEAILRGDVPCMVARVGERTYHAADPIEAVPRPIEGAELAISAAESSWRQVAGMDEQDLARQVGLIESSYVAAHLSMQSLLLEQGGRVEQGAAEVAVRTADAAELDAFVLAMLERLADSAVSGGPGEANWIDAVHDPSTGTIKPSALTTSLYSGRGGIALLLELAYRRLGRRDLLELAKASVGWHAAMMRSQPDRIAAIFELEPISGMGDRGGLLAACWAIGRHEGQGAHRDLARRIVASISPRTIQRDAYFDVVNGGAGAMLLLMSLLREDPSIDVRGVVLAIGEHLAANVSEVDGLGWTSSRWSRSLNGVGHGRAGIAMALLEAGVRFDRPDFRRLAIEAMRVEHAMHSTEGAGGWPDLRGCGAEDAIPAPNGFEAWCTGADGIAISRAAALEHVDEPFLREDLELALGEMRRHGIFSGRHHLCCGMAGRIESLRLIARLLGRRDLRAEAERLATSMTAPSCPDRVEGGVTLLQGYPGQAWMHLALRMDEPTSILRLQA